MKTPVFVRFSTVAGSRGSSDLARDVRGFAVKFYTDEGNFDLVGNNIPVFFIQDAVKFPDLVHAVKPEPHNEMPQAASAHDTFWDFISLMPESMHMIMWVMSDRAIPRSFRMMEGFGVHTFRLVDERGDRALREVPLEAAARRALGAVGRGAEDLGQGPRLPPPRPLGGDRDRRLPGVGARAPGDRGGGRAQVRLRPARSDEDRPRGARAGASASAGWSLNRNPDNFFAETEQVAFHPGHIVPGIDFTDDPLLQGRLFSYTDTQLLRLGGPNFHEIPINRPVARAAQQPARRAHAPDDQPRAGRATSPTPSAAAARSRRGGPPGGFVSYPERARAARRCARAARSSSITSARPRCSGTASPSRSSSTSCRRCGSSWARSRGRPIRERMVGMLAQVDRDPGRPGGRGPGPAPSPRRSTGRSTTACRPTPIRESSSRIRLKQKVERSQALSMAGTVQGHREDPQGGDPGRRRSRRGGGPRHAAGADRPRGRGRRSSRPTAAP